MIIDLSPSMQERVAEWELGYLTASIDCEGSICIESEKSGTHLHALVCISNTKLTFLEFLQKGFGGKIIVKSNRDQFKTQAYELRWFGYSAKPVLQLIVNDLVIKKEQAKLYLQFPLHKVRSEYTTEETLLRKEIFLKMKTLNKRNFVKITVEEIK